MLEKLVTAHATGKLQFFGKHADLAQPQAFAAALAPLRHTNWFVYSKRPFAGPQAVLAYLSRYTHRVAIANSRLIALNSGRVTFKVKDYRVDGPGRHKTMTLDAAEFIRRFLIHVLPRAFTEFAITGSSPTALAVRPSRVPANSWRSSHQTPIPTAQQLTKLRIPVYPLPHARVAAVA